MPEGVDHRQHGQPEGERDAERSRCRAGERLPTASRCRSHQGPATRFPKTRQKTVGNRHDCSSRRFLASILQEFGAIRPRRLIHRSAQAKRHQTDTAASCAAPSVRPSPRGVLAMFLRRRRLIAASGLAVASSALPRVAIGQADRRPPSPSRCSRSPTAPPAGTLARAVECRLAHDLLPRDADRQNSQGQLESVPRMAESWKRIDERTVEVALRKGVKFHNGDEMTADDVAFTFGGGACSARLRHHQHQDLDHFGSGPQFGRRQDAAGGGACRRQAPPRRRSRRSSRRQIHGALHQRDARRHARRAARRSAATSSTGAPTTRRGPGSTVRGRRWHRPL